MYGRECVSMSACVCGRERVCCKGQPIHCKNENVYSTPLCPNTHTVYGLVYWDNLVCSTHFHFYSVLFIVTEQ